MPNELSEKVYPDGTVVKLRDDTAREQIAGLIKTTGERTLAFSNGNCTIDLTTIDDSAHELLTVYAWGPDVPLSFSLVNWNLRRYKIFHLSNTSYTGNLAVCLVYRTNPQA